MNERLKGSAERIVGHKPHKQAAVTVMTNQDHPVDIADLLERPIGRARIRLFILCGLIMAIEGFDMLMMGSILPIIANGLGVTPAALSEVFITQGVGLALGYTLIAPLADRVGRRPIIITCVAAFATFTLATVLASTVHQVAILRFAAFLFFGGAVPNVIALVGEMSAVRLRSRQIVLLNGCLAIGAGLGGLLAPAAAAGSGWQGAFLYGGIAPFMLLPALILWLPESVAFLVVRGRPAAEIRKSLTPISPEAALIERFVSGDPPVQKASVRLLFQNGLGRETVLFILAGSMLMLASNLLVAWLPTFWTLLAGFELRQASAIGAISSIGAVVSPFILILLMEKFGLKPTLVVFYSAAAAAMLLFAVDHFTPALAVVMALSYGIFVVGAISGLYALMMSTYDAGLRATAIGWTAGLARIGSICGPALGGWMLAAQFGRPAIAVGFALPLGLAALAVAGLRFSRSSMQSDPTFNVPQADGRSA